MKSVLRSKSVRSVRFLCVILRHTGGANEVILGIPRLSSYRGADIEQRGDTMPRGDPTKIVPNSARTPQRVKEITTKAGQASGEARRKKTERRNLVQTILDGTYKLNDGEEVTGEELFIRGLVTNLSDPKSRNWHVAVKIIAEATGMTMTDDAKKKLSSEIDKIKADTDLTREKIKVLQGGDNLDDIEDDELTIALESVAEEMNNADK